MSTDVLPAPVGPTTRLNAPRLKRTSPSTRSRNVCRDGVALPSSASRVHANVARPKPSAALSPPVGAAAAMAASSAEVSVKASSSSVWAGRSAERVARGGVGAYVPQEVRDASEGDVSWESRQRT